MRIEELSSEDLIEVIRKYIKNFDYDTMDIDDDSMTITLDNGKHIFINVGVDNGEIEG